VSRLPGHGAFGLRGRIVGVVLITAVATLAVAALALLGPLENSLRNAEKTTLKTELGHKGALLIFARASLDHVSTNRVDRGDLLRDQSNFVRRLDARFVDVLRPPGTSASIVAPTHDPSDQDDPFDDVRRAFLTGRPQYTFGFVDGQEYARAAIRFVNKDRREYVLAVRKSIGEIPEVVGEVRRAFLDAALAGLALSLILGIPLSARLVRRLRRLREAALELAQGGPTVEVPVDRAHDEVGDLARTLATMQQRLRQQEEARRAFVATASHELRTPLTSLDGMLELLQDDLRYADPDVEDARELVARARAQSRRLGRLAADLLDLSRMDAQVQLRSEPVELGEMSRAVLAEFELGAEERGIQIELELRSRAIWALGDPGSIARIMRILVDNAVRVSPHDSEIRVRLRRGRQVTLSVSDEGPGIPEGKLQDVFERFYSERPQGESFGKHSGLGLSISKQIVEALNGRIRAENRHDAEGRVCGARFVITLPKA